MYNYNCPDCKETKLQTDKNARKINEVIEHVNALIPLYNDTDNFIEQKATEKVEEVANVKVPEIINSVIHENIVNIKYLPLYNKNDISIVLNNIEFKEGITYELNEVEVECLSPVNITLNKRTNLKLNSKILCHDSFMKLKLMGSNKVYIREVLPTTNNVFDYGIHLIHGNGCDLTFDTIKDFVHPLKLKPINEWDYIQYCKFNFQHIKGDLAIDISVTGENTWVNENTFNGGGLTGRINVVMYKDFIDTNFRSLINNNKFYNLSVNSKEECIKIAKSSGETNYFYNIRTWEQDEVFTGEYYINDNGGSNYFECMSGVPYNRLKLGADSKFDGKITGPWDASSNKFPLIGYTAFGDKDTDKPYIVEKTLKNIGSDFTNGAFNLYTPCEMLICNMGNGQTATVRLKETLFFRNNNFYVLKNGWNNSTSVTLTSPTGKSVTITQNGLYLLSLGDSYDYFSVYKLYEGDGDSAS